MWGKKKQAETKPEIQMNSYWYLRHTNCALFGQRPLQPQNTAVRTQLDSLLAHSDSCSQFWKALRWVALGQWLFTQCTNTGWEGDNEVSGNQRWWRVASKKRCSKIQKGQSWDITCAACGALLHWIAQLTVTDEGALGVLTVPKHADVCI